MIWLFEGGAFMNYVILTYPNSDTTTKTVQILKAMRTSGYNFHGKTPTISFSLHYPCDDSFRELTILHNIINANKRFKNHFYGLVEVDISEWTGCEDDDRFAALLDYSERNAAVFAFIIRTGDREKAETLIQKIKTCSMKTSVMEDNARVNEKRKRVSSKISLIREENENEAI